MRAHWEPFVFVPFIMQGRKKSADLKLLLSFPPKTSTAHLNSALLLHAQRLSWGCSQNRGSHRMLIIACWVVKIMSNCFCGILAVYSFGPGQGNGIAEKSIFQVINLNILKLEGKKRWIKRKPKIKVRSCLIQTRISIPDKNVDHGHSLGTVSVLSPPCFLGSHCALALQLGTDNWCIAHWKKLITLHYLFHHWNPITPVKSLSSSLKGTWINHLAIPSGTISCLIQAVCHRQWKGH